MRCVCFVPGCTNTSTQGNVLLSFHRIPRKNNAKWLAAIGTKAEKWDNNKRICSDHFKPEDFVPKSSKRILKKNVLPSVNLPMMEYSRENLSTETLDSLKINSDDSIVSSRCIDDLNENQLGTPRGTPERPVMTNEEYQPSPSFSEIRRSQIVRRLIMNEKENKAKKKLMFNIESEISSSVKNTLQTSSGRTSLKKRLIKAMHTYSRSPIVPQNVKEKQRHKIRQYQYRLGNSKRSLVRAKKKVQHLSSVLHNLKSSRNLSTTALNFLETTFSGIPCAVMKRMLLNKRKQTTGTIRSAFPPELRSFALTIQFYSSKAYDYVRKTFDLALPAPSTLRSWMSKIDCTPGFTQCSLEALRLRAEMFQKNNPGKKLMVALVLDEMAIKKEIIIEKHNQSVWGYVDIGAETELADERDLATEALTLMVVGVNDNFKLPVAYFLINSLTGAERANIVRETLHQLSTVNVKVLSVTCDGPQVHLKMMSELGCQILNPNSMQVHFNSPADNSKVRIIFDVAHMLKLVRNNWANEGIFKDENGASVDWKYIEKLNNIQEEEGLYLGNKLRSKHLEFKKAVMKVNLAAQTISQSVADALEFLSKDLQLEEFQNVMPTVKFIRVFDELFDILNSRNPFGRGMKTPLRVENESYWRPKLEHHLNYIKMLKTVNGRPLYLTQKKTPFIGFLVSATSLLDIYDEEVKLYGQLKYILTYKFSQDHLELFFCSIRSRNGSNNNPNALQFMHTYRRLLMHIDIKSNTGNCIAQDNTGVLSVSSSRLPQITDINQSRILERNLEELEENVSVILPMQLNEFHENVISYISGFVVRNVKKKLKCIQCCEALETLYDELDSSMKLIRRKSKGGLTYPSRSVRIICSKVEQKIQTIFKVSAGLPPKNIFIKSLHNEIQSLFMNESIFPELEDHVFDFAPYEQHHKKILLELVVNSYGSIRIHSLGKKINKDISGEKIRKVYSKLILFKHQ